MQHNKPFQYHANKQATLSIQLDHCGTANGLQKIYYLKLETAAHRHLYTHLSLSKLRMLTESGGCKIK